MKRKIALLLSVFMLIVAMIPAQVFAEGDKGLEDAIKLVKSKFTIPESYTEFNYDISSFSGTKVWYLNWREKNGVEGNINVSVNEKGDILNYGHYKPYDYSNSKKLPKVSKEQAKTAAEEFINKVNPELLSQLKYQENSNTSIQDYEYYFNYVRIIGQTPYYANTVGVSVDRQTGEVRNYYCTWNDALEFPSIEGAISLEKAQQAYKDKLGLELRYNYTYDNDNIKIFAAYMPKFRYNAYVDALTGEKVELNTIYSTMHDGYASTTTEKSKLAMAAGDYAGAGPVLTNEELEAVEKVSKLLSKEEAEQIARSIKVLEISSEFKVGNYRLSRGWPDRNEFVWNIEFSKQSTDKTDIRYINVSINAANGEVKSFNTYFPHKDGEIAKYDESAAKSAAEALLKELQPAKLSETYLNENNNNYPIPYMGTEKPSYYNFTYTRKVNEVPFDGNSLNVGYDAISGKITSFNVNWFTMEFPSVEKVISVDTVYENLFKEIGLELQYVTEPKNMNESKIIYGGENPELEVRLVYGVKPGKPVNFDANTGVIIDYTGQPYKENKPVEYSDVEGHFAESEIKVLAENGIALEGTEFKPDQGITQKDFFTLLSKTLNYYMPYPVLKSEKEIDDLYTFLMREGIVKEGEKAPEAAVTREDAVKFIIRAMKFEKVASLKGIFNSDFKDIDQINPELVGHVILAKGFGIVNGFEGYFNPKSEMTRAQAAVMIYNYLQN